MKKHTFTQTVKAVGLFCAIFTNMAVQAQDSSVWKVSKGEDSVLIGGSVHILPVSEFPLPEQFDRAYQIADSLVFETRIPDPTDFKAQQQMMAAMAYPQQDSLLNHISEQTRTELSDYFAQFGANFEQLAQFKPGMIMLTMTAMEAQRAQLAGHGVDMYFAQRASQDAKPAEYLETVEMQTNMLANLAIGEEDVYLQGVLKDMPEFKAQLTGLIAAWRAGDTDQLDALVIESLKTKAPKIYQQLFVQRNQNWVPQIEAMFGDQDKEFVIVGVGHLVGEESVLKLLRDKGYQVEML